QQLGEDRTAGQGEARRLEVEQVCPEDVAGHQVGGELDPPELEPDGVGEAVREQGFGGPRRAFEQDVAAGEQSNEHELDGRVLPDYGLRDLAPDRTGKRLDFNDFHSWTSLTQ